MHGYLSDELTRAGILAFFVVGNTLTYLQQYSAGSSFHFENCIKIDVQQLSMHACIILNIII